MRSPGGLRPDVTLALPLSEVAATAGATMPDAPNPLPDALPDSVTIRGVTLDSRSVCPGDLYAALPGSHSHGARYAATAAGAGAVAVLTDPAGVEFTAGLDRPVLVVPDPRAVLGQVAAAVYGHPCEALTMLGVTGTNGKTTTTYLLEAGLRGTGRRAGLVGTIETRVGDERIDSVRTTPEAPDLQALLAVMRERGCTACAMEVSSHALVQHRVDGVRFDVAGFTNLSQDHLDFHHDFESYFAAKASLFTPDRSRHGVVCVDDEWGRRLARQAGIPLTTLATSPESTATQQDPPVDWRVARSRLVHDGAGTDFVLEGKDGRRLELRSPLVGSFNVANTALAALMLLQAGVAEAEIAPAISAAGGVPGRMERVIGPPGTPLAVVDYAHTPEAVAAALGALRPATRGRLVVVLGAGGDRDHDKRGPMGAAAALGADVVIVTDDNPRSEDPATIRAAVLAGARTYGPDTVVVEVGDRRAAIEAALEHARSPQDTVLVAGKGHERGQEAAGVVTPFVDRDVVAQALRRAGDSR